MPTISDINAEARALCDADTTSYPAATLLRRINEAYEMVIAWILQADGLWQWDDTNYDDFPIGTQNLVDNQGKYSFNDKFLEIEEVQVKDINGDWSILKPIDQKEYSDHTPLSEAFEDKGQPIMYDKLTDDSIQLFPAPSSVDMTLTNGLKIKYRRTADLFTSAEVTAGTKEPGFLSPYHYILSYMAAIPYCMSYKKDRIALYEKRVDDLKRELMAHYSRREKDKRKKITMKRRCFK